MFKTAFRKAAVAAALVGGMGAAVASPTLTNSLGSFANFGGFDWASNGTAVVTGFLPTAASNTFDLRYWASAAVITNLGGTPNNAATAGLFNGAYEYTIEVLLNETSTCTVFTGPVCTTASFNVNSGTFNIWYDTTPDVNQTTGAGITDGILLLSGTVFAQPGGGFNVITGGNATLQGDVTFTNNAFIQPDLEKTTATSTLQLGSNITNFTPPSGQPGAGGSSTAIPGSTPNGATPIFFQADANQSFTARVIPEPDTLALVGLALTGLGFGAARRRKA